MVWQGLTDAQICQSIKDPQQNKNRNLDQLVEHLTEDKLVMWAWNPVKGEPRPDASRRVRRQGKAMAGRRSALSLKRAEGVPSKLRLDGV